MAAPAFGAIGTQLQGSGSTMNVPAPSGVAVNDILRVSAFVDTLGVTVTGMPSGWAQATGSPVTGPDNHRLYVMWKRADSGDTGASTFDFTLSGSTYRNASCERYTGAVTTGDPWDVTNAAGSNVSQTTTEDVATTTTQADTLLCWSATNWSGGTWTPPSGFTERRDSGDGVCTSADKAQASAGSTGSIVGTCTGSDKRCAWVGALESTAGGTVEVPGYFAPKLPGRIGPDGKVYLPRPLSFENAPSGGAVALDGHVDTAFGGTGLVGLSLPLAGNVNATSQETGLLGLSLPIAGVVAAASQETGNARVAIGMTGVVPAASLETGNAVLAQAMTGVVPASAVLTGVATLSISMTGTVSASAGLTGLTSLALQLSSHVDAAFGMTGQVTNLVPLSAVMPASALLTGNLQLTLGLAGMVPTASLVPGQFVVARGLAGMVPAASQESGTARLTLGLTGVVPTASLLTGGISVPVLLTGTVPVAVRLSGGLILLISAHVEIVGLLNRHYNVTMLSARFDADGLVRVSLGVPVLAHWDSSNFRRTYAATGLKGVE